jgi:hypothetical protein
MTAIRLATLAVIASVGAAHAQSQQPAEPFEGIEGEVQPATGATVPLLQDTTGYSFDIGRSSPTEQSIITENRAARGDFFRSTIHSGRRAGATSGTGLTIFDRLFDLE